MTKEWLDQAIHAAELGGEILKDYWGKITKIKEKSYPGELVTEADVASETVILAHLQKEFPNHNFLSEEAGRQPVVKNDAQWIIDPLDGTTNYTHQYPMVAVSIGLFMKGKPYLGVIYNPFHNELFTALKREGATLNGHPISVSMVERSEESLLATGFAYDRREAHDTNYPEFFHLTNYTQGVRRGGSAALDLAYVACGRLDGFWERGLSQWDMAAGAIIVEEAGGSVTAYDSSPFQIETGKILATNGKIHKSLSHELMRLQKEKK